MSQETQKEADERWVIVIPTFQFYKSEIDYQKRLQFLPSQIKSPWHRSGLIGIHIEEVKEALREIIVLEQANFSGM